MGDDEASHDDGGLRTIPDALHRAAARWTTKTAIVGDGERWTYGELLERAEDVGRALLGSGVEPGDRVALWAPNSPEWIAASFGAYLAGAVLVPVNTRYRGPEAAHVLRTARAGLLLTVGALPDGRDPLAELDLAGPYPHLRERIALPGAAPAGTVAWEGFLGRGDAVGVDALAARWRALEPGTSSDIIFTSGTTGAAKGAVLTHGASVRTYECWSEMVGLREDDTYLTVYPFFHTAGLKSAVLACVLTGATLVPQAVFDPVAMMRRVEEEQATVLPGPPTVFQGILDHPERPRFDLRTLRLSVTGAAVVPVSVIERMREDLQIPNVVTGYGLTETTGTVSMCRFTDPPDVVARTVGKPLPGVELRIALEGKVRPQGEPGEVQVRGFNVMQGYFDAPEATAAAIDPDGWLATGDVGLVDDDGNLRITDRLKDMFIVGGFNAYPAEIENALLAHPAIAQVAVVRVPDDRLGEVGAAVVVPAPGHEIDPDEVLAWARERMANFKVPRLVRVVDALPLNATGKVLKYELREALRAERTDAG